ncbi:MAG: molybdopterin-dependent oxidoreductase [Candidatus Nezhaarchaeota archaeon]|nr:molybdopterin-dependent oxidoreductase [Candidatus Nezhaarchaeota archaeon]
MAKEKNVETKKGCCYFCTSIGCAVLVNVIDDPNSPGGKRIVGVEPDPSISGPNGQGCPRLAFAPEYFYHSMRIKYPLKRAGKRGDGRWQRISWDQALDEIASKLKEIREKYGPEAVAATHGTGRSGSEDWCMTRFMNLWGSPNRVGPIICSAPSAQVDQMVFGWYDVASSYAAPGKEQSTTIVNWSRNRPDSQPVAWPQMMEQWRKGAKFIVADPRCIEVCKYADIWLQPRPGTDLAIVLAWLRIIVYEGLYDRDFVVRWTNAPFLVRTDKMKILREWDLNEGGKKENFVVWDLNSKGLAVWNSKSLTYDKPGVSPALEGEFEVTGKDGEKIQCKTVWTLLKERIEPYTPEWAEEVSWVSARKIRESAYTYAKSKPAIFIKDLTPEQLPNGTQFLFVRNILRAITGNLDVEGGHVLTGPPPIRARGEMSLDEKFPTPEQRKKQIGADKFKLLTYPGYDLIAPNVKEVWGMWPGAWRQADAHPPSVFRAMLTGKPYPVKACLITYSNPMVAFPNSRLVFEALMSCELLVTHEIVWTPAAMISDYVLPSTCWMDRPELNTMGASGDINVIIAGERTVPPYYEARDGYDFWRGLGIRLGQGDYWPWKTLEEALDYRFEPMGVTFQEFIEMGRIYFQPVKHRKYEEKGFGTPTRRVEIWSTILEELGYDPLPHWREPTISPISTPEIAKEYPLVLTSGGRHLPFHHSEFRQLESCRRQRKWPMADIHPETARQYGITNGDWVWIETPIGAVKMVARVTPGIHPQVVHAEHGWWYPEEPGIMPNLFGVFKSNINVVVMDDPKYCDPEMGLYPFRTQLCKIRKAEMGP